MEHSNDVHCAVGLKFDKKTMDYSLRSSVIKLRPAHHWKVLVMLITILQYQASYAYQYL